MKVEGTIPDQEFIVEFRMAIERYLCALDQWEAATRQCFAFPGYAAAAIEEAEAEHLEYRKCRRELEQMLPRARVLCARYHLENPFDDLLPCVTGSEEGICRRVRAAVSKSLMQLHAACIKPDWLSLGALLRGSVVQRLVSRFS